MEDQPKATSSILKSNRQDETSGLNDIIDKG